MVKGKQKPKSVGLEDRARYLGLATATISNQLNGPPAAAEIPAAT
jgi:hypothetical protein